MPLNVFKAKLNSLRKNLPTGDVEESVVDSFNAMVDEIDEELEDPEVGHFKVKPTDVKQVWRRRPNKGMVLSEDRYCEPRIFKTQVEGLWEYLIASGVIAPDSVEPTNPGHEASSLPHSPSRFFSFLEQALFLGARGIRQTALPTFIGYVVYVGLAALLFTGIFANRPQVTVAAIVLLMIVGLLAILLLFEVPKKIRPAVAEAIVLMVVVCFLAVSAYAVFRLLNPSATGQTGQNTPSERPFLRAEPTRDQLTPSPFIKIQISNSGQSSAKNLRISCKSAIETSASNVIWEPTDAKSPTDTFPYLHPNMCVKVNCPFAPDYSSANNATAVELGTIQYQDTINNQYLTPFCFTFTVPYTTADIHECSQMRNLPDLK